MTRIRQLRALVGLRGISQQSLAAKLGMGRDRLLRIENGVTQPTADEADALASILKCAVPDLGIKRLGRKPR